MALLLLLGHAADFVGAIPNDAKDDLAAVIPAAFFAFVSEYDHLSRQFQGVHEALVGG